MPETINTIDVYQLDSYEIEITVTVNDIAKDISGSYIFFMIKEEASDPDEEALCDITITPEELTDPTHGITLMELSSDDMDIPVRKKYIYAFKLIDADGKPSTFDVGYWNINVNPIQRVIPVES